MKSLLIILIISLLSAMTTWSQDSINSVLTPQENTVGRYQLLAINNNLYRIDTSTGRVWEYVEREIEKGVSRAGWDELYESFIYSEKDNVAIYSKIIDNVNQESDIVWDIDKGTLYLLKDALIVDALIDSIGIEQVKIQSADSISVKLGIQLETILSRIQLKTEKE